VVRHQDRCRQDLGREEAGLTIIVALGTAPDLDVAERLAQDVLERRLVACVTILPGARSHYWWRDRLETAEEAQIVMKTTQDRWPLLQAHWQQIHPYHTPELIALPVTAGHRPYLDWITKETAHGKNDD